MSWGRKAAMAATLTGVLVLSGCGGGSSGLSTGDLAKKLVSICGTYASQIKAVPQPADVLTNSTSAATFFTRIGALYNKAQGDIDALKPADGAKAQWSKVTTSFHSLVSLINTITTKAQNKDRTGIQLLTQLGPATASLNTAADAIGATGCSKTTR
jgi:hypothetical protein